MLEYSKYGRQVDYANGYRDDVLEGEATTKLGGIFIGILIKLSQQKNK